MLQTLMGWLDALPLSTLYAAIAGLSAFENFFPPFPSDAVVAFGSFLASRAEGSALTVLFLGWFGNVAGATAEDRIRKLYKKYGFAGLFVSRFLPGVRAIVPPFAGAMKLPAFGVILSIASASLVWFGVITFLAFRAGNNWDLLQQYLVQSGKVAGAIATAIVVVAVGFWLWKRRARKNE
jgi:membrane protein DedA with SNARE-associated domain